MIRTITGLAIAASLIFTVPAATVKAEPGGNNEKAPELDAEWLKKGNPKLDSGLNRLAATANDTMQFRAMAQQADIKIKDNRVRVTVECQPGQKEQGLELVRGAGEVESTYGDMVQALLPVNTVNALAENPAVRYIQLPYQPVPAAIVSEGVSLIGADDWQTAGYDGSGVKVAVLDTGFQGYTALLGTELPATVTAQSFNGDINGGGQVHGTACAEIVYDVAPGAQLYLVNYSTFVEFGNAVDWLIAQDVDIISSSVGWPAVGPGDGTGPVNDIVAKAKAAGILWVQSAGNNAQSHWSGLYNDGNGNNWNDFSNSPIDEGNTISVTAGQQIVGALTWNDQWGSSANDYDLLLIDANNQIVAGSTNTQSGTGFPYEAFSYTATYTGEYYLAIGKKAGDTRPLQLFSSHTFQYRVAEGSIVVPGDSPNVMTVGAVCWNTPSTVESFSSQGPTNDNRVKPDVVAPDGVSTVSYGTRAFYGTSASTPHTAGTVSLVKQMYLTKTVDELQAFIESDATDLGYQGKDQIYGNGFTTLRKVPPSVITENPTNIIHSGARLNGNLVSKGIATSVNVSFEWSSNPGIYHSETPPRTINNIGTFYDDISGLSSSPSYFFRAKALGSDTTYGEEKSFTIWDSWSHTYGGTNSDGETGPSIQPTSDGGYIIATSTWSFGAGYSDVYLIKIDSQGNQIWSNTFGGNDNDHGHSVCTTPDGGYIVVGNTMSFGSGSSDVYVIKTDSYGNAIWTKTFGGGGEDYGHCIQKTLDGNFIIAGITWSFGNGFTDIYLVKIDIDGNLIWSKTIGDSGGNGANWIEVTSDGGFIITGTTQISVSDTNLYLVKTDSYGDVTWSKSFGDQALDIGYSVKQTSDGGYIVTGFFKSSYEAGTDLWVIKTDSEGNLSWDKKYGWEKGDEGKSIALYSDDSYLICGSTEYHGDTNSNLYVINIDSSGNLKWTYFFGGPGWENGDSVLALANGGFVVAGTSGYDVYFTKLSPSELPDIVTENTSSISTNSARLNANLAGLGGSNSVSVSFEWGQTDSYGKTTSPQTKTSTGAISATITGLTPYTTYHYRAKAVGEGTSYGEDRTFTTLSTPPSVTTGNANPSFTSAQLQGSVTNLGTATSVTTRFAWGTSESSLTNIIECQTRIGTGPISGNITGLSPAVTYYYRAEATGHGTGQGTVKSFTTQSTPPAANTDNASNTGHFKARLNGSLTSAGTATAVNVSFEWGTTHGSYIGVTTPVSMSSPGNFNYDLTGLSTNTTYFYRVKAVGHGTVYGSEKSFKTLAGGEIPAASTDNATNVTYNSARLSGNVTSPGTVQTVQAYFAWGTAPGVYTITSQPATVNAAGPVYFDITGLNASTTYYYRFYVKFSFSPGDDGEIAAEPEYSFTTRIAPPPPPSGGFGGGFGGGGGGAPAGPGTTNLALYTNSEGLFMLDGEAKSEDSRVNIDIAKGVLAQTKDKTPLKSIKIVTVDSPAVLPSGFRLVGKVYEITPDGATFAPGITLTLTYEAAEIPEGTDINSLTIITYNPTTAKWEILPSTLDKAKSSAATTIGHFSIYAIAGKKAAAPPTTPVYIPLPAKFTISEIKISPAPGTISSGENSSMVVTTKVSNTGEKAGDYELILKINNVTEETKTVTVGAGAVKEVSFTVNRSLPGEYEVEINGQKGTFSFKEAPAATTTLGVWVGPPPEKKGTNWGLIGLAAAGIAAVGVGLVLWRNRRSKYEKSKL